MNRPLNIPRRDYPRSRRARCHLGGHPASLIASTSDRSPIPRSIWRGFAASLPREPALRQISVLWCQNSMKPCDIEGGCVASVASSSFALATLLAYYASRRATLIYALPLGLWPTLASIVLISLVCVVHAAARRMLLHIILRATCVYGYMWGPPQLVPHGAHS